MFYDFLKSKKSKEIIVIFYLLLFSLLFLACVNLKEPSSNLESQPCPIQENLESNSQKEEYFYNDSNYIFISSDSTFENPIDLANYNIESNSMIFFASKTYYIKSFNLKNKDNVVFCLNNANIICLDNYFLYADQCHNLTIQNGKILGYEDGIINNSYFALETAMGIMIKNSQNIYLNNLIIKNIGNQYSSSSKGIYLLGDCNKAIIQNCSIENIQSGIGDGDINKNGILELTEKGDGLIHTYGIFINRLASNPNLYTRQAIIQNCNFYNIKGIDKESPTSEFYLRGEGEGIFIQQLPFKDMDTQEIKCLDSNIIIDNCNFYNCSKRGVKATCQGVQIKNSRFNGEYWFAPIEFQYGYGTVENCQIYNSYKPNDNDVGIISGIVICDGGVTVKDTYINCKYENNQCHNGITFNERNNRSPFSAEIPWDICTFNNVVFDDVNYAIWIYGKPKKNHLRGIEILNCKFQSLYAPYAVCLGQGIFDDIDKLRFIDFIFYEGRNCQEMNEAIKKKKAASEGNESIYFSYPIKCVKLYPTTTYELYSQYWDLEDSIY